MKPMVRTCNKVFAAFEINHLRVCSDEQALFCVFSCRYRQKTVLLRRKHEENLPIGLLVTSFL